VAAALIATNVAVTVAATVGMAEATLMSAVAAAAVVAAATTNAVAAEEEVAGMEAEYSAVAPLASQRSALLLNNVSHIRRPGGAAWKGVAALPLHHLPPPGSPLPPCSTITPLRPNALIASVAT
jgi:hypothetical protein